MIHLSKRLQAVADLVQGKRPLDVGCDHCHVPIYLIQSGRAEHVLAFDIHEGPLLRAQEHIQLCHLEKKIEVRISDGLSNYKKKEADSLIMSGLGGITICNILKSACKSGYLQDFTELVLSPHADLLQVRRCLHILGYAIDHETMVTDAGKYYTVIHALPGDESYHHVEDDLYGKYLIDHKDIILLRYLTVEKEKKQNLYAQISRMDSEGARAFVPVLADQLQTVNAALARFLRADVQTDMEVPQIEEHGDSQLSGNCQNI